MRVLVTGASGHVGGAIALDLAQSGHEVVGLCRSRLATKAISEQVQLDLAEAGFHDRLVSAVPRCDAIIHAAAAIRPRLDDMAVSRANCVGTQQIVRLAQAWETRQLVYLSSVPVIGTPRCLPITEDHSIDAPTAYHASKLFGEALLRLAVREGLTAVTLRLTSPVGPAMPKSRILSVFVGRALVGQTLSLLGKGTRKQNYVDVRDVAQAIRCCLKRRARGLFLIGGSESTSNLALARQCVDVLGSESTVEFDSRPDPEEGIRWCVSIEKARRELAYNPNFTIEHSIRAVAADHALRSDQ